MSDAPDIVDTVPLVVDVDGTLVKGDLLHESALQFLAHYPLEAWKLGVWLVGGKAALKDRLAARAGPGGDNLPLREETLASIRAAQAEGREVFLASASHAAWVEPLAARIGGIAGVLCSDASRNLAGPRKAAALVERFGERGFDYIGDRPVDLPVWEAARRRLVVAANAGFERRVRRRFDDAEVIARPRTPSSALLRAMRPHQWAKNALVFLPLIAGHRLFEAASVVAAIIAFLAFCCAASSTYLVNDLLDLPADRAHPRKSKRPLAAGELPVLLAIVQALVLMVVAAGLAALLPPRFALVLASYVALTLAYSLYLKRRVLIDVIVLGGLYAIRVLGGVEADGYQQSPWLLMFSLFLFLSLATVKRCAELVALRNAGRTGPPGRGYLPSDLAVLNPLGAAAGYGAVLVVALYLSSEAVVPLYHHPSRLWLVCPVLLYWISRMFLLADRDQMHDDPVIFALTDRVSWLAGILVGAIILTAL